MKAIRNTSHQPLSVPLPRGKKLHLGPGKVGEISTPAADHPPLKAMVDGGVLEILDDRESHTATAANTGRTHVSTQGYRSGAKSGRRGDR